MLTVIGIMAGGILAGFLLRNRNLSSKLGKPVFAIVLILLFLMGLAVGGNPAIAANLPHMGGQALLLAFMGTLGSVSAAFLVYRLFFRKDFKKDSEHEK